MKTLGLKMLALFLLVGATAVRGQERDAEVPGDNFSLEGALELFKKSESPEQFEKMLNDKDSRVNNLDLNGDNYIDYVRVIDRNEGNIHTFTMQAVISDDEVQDVAVITLEKLADGKAVLQIIGDEDVYGIETIIEPTREVRINAGTTTTTDVENVWAWPSVQYIYSPSYVVWVSPWSWTIRPIWWYYWQPVVYYEYVSYWRPYRPYYTRCYAPRIVYASRIYRPYRATSVIVHRRHEVQITRYRTVHRDEFVRSRSQHTGSARYANNNFRGERRSEVRSDKPSVRTRSNDQVTATRTRTQNDARSTRSTNHKTEWNDNSVQRERTERDNTVERNKPVQRERVQRDNTAQRDNSVQRERSTQNVVKREQSNDRSGFERTPSRQAERNTSVQRERATSGSFERQRNTVQPRQEQPQRERVSTPSRSSESRSSSFEGNRSSSRSSEPRSSSFEGSNRSSSDRSTSGSSQSQGRGKRNQ